MAKVSGQTVESEDKHQYEACLELARADGTIRKRFPKRIIAHALPAKLKQQARFKEAIALFHNLNPGDRTKWYDNRPVWNSYLWYYNYFIMSALSGNANVDGGGAGVIKTIQVLKEEVPTTGGKSFTISEVDAAKTVVMVYGSSYISDVIQRHDGTMNDNEEITIGLSPNVDPALTEVKVKGGGGWQDTVEGSGSGWWGDIYCSYLSASQVKLSLVNLYSPYTFGYSVELIEHKAQTVYPVITSIAAEAVVIDWSKAPSVAADVSIVVIEYI